MQLFGKKEHLKEYIESAKNGNPRAQKLIYEMLSAKMYAVCLRYMAIRRLPRMSCRMVLLLCLIKSGLIPAPGPSRDGRGDCL